MPAEPTTSSWCGWITPKVGKQKEVKQEMNLKRSNKKEGEGDVSWSKGKHALRIWTIALLLVSAVAVAAIASAANNSTCTIVSRGRIVYDKQAPCPKTEVGVSDAASVVRSLCVRFQSRGCISVERQYGSVYVDSREVGFGCTP